MIQTNIIEYYRYMQFFCLVEKESHELVFACSFCVCFLVFFSAVSVYNYANKDKPNGVPEGSVNGTILCARVPDSNNPAKLLVAPCFLPNLFAGPYWVLMAGPSSDNYEWAIVSGGQPTVQYPDGCTTSESGTNNAGLWLFSRTPVANPIDLQKMKSVLKDLGFTLSRLHEVPQQSCHYAGAYIKS